MIRLVAFDLDGTLTQHKTKLDVQNRDILDRLAQKYALVMVGAGQCRRIFEQMGCYPLDIIGNYGLQYAAYNQETGTLDVKRDEVFSVDRVSVAARIEKLREKHGYATFVG